MFTLTDEFTSDVFDASISITAYFSMGEETCALDELWVGNAVLGFDKAVQALGNDGRKALESRAWLKWCEYGLADAQAAAAEDRDDD